MKVNNIIYCVNITIHLYIVYSKNTPKKHTYIILESIYLSLCPKSKLIEHILQYNYIGGDNIDNHFINNSFSTLLY